MIRRRSAMTPPEARRSWLGAGAIRRLYTAIDTKLKLDGATHGKRR